jgi:hypothetical protein
MIFFLGWIAVMAVLIIGGAAIGAHNSRPGPGYRTDLVAAGAVSGSFVGFIVGMVLTFIGFLVAGMVV